MIDGQDKLIGSPNLFNIPNRSYIRVQGLTLQNNVYPGQHYATGCGIAAINSHHVQIINNITNRTASSGILVMGYKARQQYVEGDEDFVVDGNTIKDACIYGDTSVLSGQTIAWQEHLDFIKVSNFVARNNKILGGWKEKLDAKEGSNYGRIYNNYIDGTYITQPPSNFYEVRGNTGIYVGGGGVANNLEVYNNRVKNEPIGISIGDEGGDITYGPIKVYNNILTDATMGIRVFSFSTVKGPKKNITINNNDIYNCAQAGIQWDFQPTENCLISKNIISKSANQLLISVSSGLTIDSNCLFGSSSTTGTNAYLVDPQYVNPDAGDFSLKTTSPIYGKGIGAQAGITPPPPPPICPELTIVTDFGVIIAPPPPPPPPPPGVTLTLDKYAIVLGDMVTMQACAPDGKYQFLFPNGSNAGSGTIPPNSCATDTLQPNSAGTWTVQILDNSTGAVLKAVQVIVT